MSDEIRIDVTKGTKVRIFEDGVEVQPQMSAEQFGELLEAIHKMTPPQAFIPMPYPQPVPIPYPVTPNPYSAPYTPTIIWKTTCDTNSVHPRYASSVAIN